MKRPIKLILTILLFLSVYSTYRLLNESEPSSSDWQTYQKKDGQLDRHKSTEQELAELNITKSKARSRGPAQSSPMPARAFPNGASLSQFDIANEYDGEWKDKLAERSIRFHDPETRVFIKHERELFHAVSKKSAIYAEQVVVTTLFANGRQESYRALVNSQNGVILSTWDRPYDDDPFRSRHVNLSSEGGLP